MQITLINGIDFVINGICVVLWLNWRSISVAQPNLSVGISLLATLKRAETRRVNRWVSMVTLGSLLALRAAFYWLIGFEFGWTLPIDLGPIVIPFRADYFGRVALYSIISFLLLLALFYSSLLLLSVINRNSGETDYLCRLVRLHLGRINHFHSSIKLILPILCSMILWVLFAPFLRAWGMVPPWVSPAHLWQQSLVFALMSILALRYVLLVILGLYLLQSYVYLGNHYFWKFINLNAKNILNPLANFSIQWGKFDLRPVVGIVVIFGISFALKLGAISLYQRLPF